MSPDPHAPSLAPPGEDVIHNIGYRDYDGPRLGRGYARRSLFVQSWRGAYGLGRSGRSKVLPMILFGIMCVPSAIMVAVTVTTGGKALPVDYTAYAVMLQPIIWLFVAIAAPQAVSLDLRFKTVPLYFSRPIERTDYVFAKYAALSAAVLVFTGAPVVLLYAGALLAELDFADQTAGFAQGLGFSVLFSLLYAAIGLALAALTPRRGFGIAAVIAVLTIPYMLVSALQAIASEQGSNSAVNWLGLGSAGTLMDGIQSAFLGGVSAFPGAFEPSTAQGFLYLGVVALVIAAACALLLRRYRKAGL